LQKNIKFLKHYVDINSEKIVTNFFRAAWMQQKIKISQGGDYYEN
jgi:hypothetical protein